MWEGFPGSELYIAKSLVKSMFGRLMGILKATYARFGGGARQEETYYGVGLAEIVQKIHESYTQTTSRRLSTPRKAGKDGINISPECSKVNCNLCVKPATKRKQPKKRKLGLKQGKLKRRKTNAQR